MASYHEKIIVDIKNEYLTCLLNILTPEIYVGLMSIYKYSCDKSKQQRDGQVASTLEIFKFCLSEIVNLNHIAIENETKRIKEACRCSEWFDDLVRAVIKSYIILLTYNNGGKIENSPNSKYHEKINVNDFVHKCYIECATTFCANPELFVNECNMETFVQRPMCLTLTHKCIRQAIIEAIHKVLPMRQILWDYLNGKPKIKMQNDEPRDKLLGKILSSEHLTTIPMVNKEDVVRDVCDNAQNACDNMHDELHDNYYGKVIQKSQPLDNPINMSQDVGSLLNMENARYEISDNAGATDDKKLDKYFQ